MSNTDPTSGPGPGTPSRTVIRLALPLAALSLALSACTQGGPAAEPTEQETTVQSSTPEPSPAPSPTANGPSASPSPTPVPTAAAPPAASAGSALLTISVKQDAAAEPVQYILECVDGAPGPASTLPNAEAACAALARLGTGFFTARPNKDVICTQQYGGPQTASITGDLNGTSVLAAFALTDGCEISRWDRVRDILGTPGGQ
ncbi:MAG: serine protease inhibitor [Micrococcaceae bacterium]|nr:serine protease inhibitor [Micrococcaceae bacterium]